MSYQDERDERVDAAPPIGILDPARVRAVIRGLEKALEKSEEGLHVSAAVFAGWALTWLEQVVEDAKLPDYEQALRHRLVTDVEPSTSLERDVRPEESS